jgi:DNA-binding beta-propeller fold protein YncE
MRRARIALAQIGRQGRRTFALVGAAAMVVASCTSGASHGTAPGQSQRTLASPSASPNPFKVIARFEASSLGLDHPIGLAIGPDGNLYVTDTSQVVAMISPEGAILRRWGRAGKGPGEFRFQGADPGDTDPAGIHASIAVGPDGQVYVSDSGNYRIEVFSATGAFIRQFGSLGSAEGQFLTPFDLAADTAGNVYVVDDKGGTVSKFSPAGDFIWRIGGFSAEDPDLVGHEHLASVDTHGRVVMTNDDKGRILYVDAKGHKVDAFSLRAGACDVTVDAAGDTFVNYGCGGPGDTEVFDRTHRLTGGWYGSCPLLSSPRFGPNGEVFALGQDGTVLKLEIRLP